MTKIALKKEKLGTFDFKWNQNLAAREIVQNGCCTEVSKCQNVLFKLENPEMDLFHPRVSH